jgi:RNA polymerase sigma-70 factor (ECF subfamily)
MGEAAPSDIELIERTCGGETDAFASLVSRYEDYVFNAVAHLVGSGHEAEDITQEVFLKAFRNIGRFRREAMFSTWLYGIMLNSVRSRWRKRGRRPKVVSLSANPGEGNPGSPQESPGDGPLEQVLRAERVELVRRSIATLPEDLREVIVLRDLEGLSYEELAESLNVPLGTVKSRLFRARNALKDKIAPLVSGEP